MMIKKISGFGLLALSIAACSGPAQETDAEVSEEQSTKVEETSAVSEVMTGGGLTLTPYLESPVYEDASLTLLKPMDGDAQNEGMVNFEFQIENYQLGEQTPGAEVNNLANSAKGQHIHLIMNNDPYSAHYTTGFEKELDPGFNIGLAFLSRSYHESVKNPNAYAVFQMAIGDASTEQSQIDLSGPMLFYSRPKGEYSGSAVERVLFDFYLVNVDLEKMGYTVVATINEDQKFEFAKWQPYLIEGLPLGENTINIKLLDENGQLVNSVMNDVTRTFTLTQ